MSAAMYQKNPEAAKPKTAPPSQTASPSIAKQPEGEWSTGLYDCFDDPSNCLITCFCPCITFGRIAEVVDRGTTSRALQSLIYCGMSRICCGWLYGGIYRAKLRRLFLLPEAPCTDWLVHCCCCLCSLCQEHRELKNRRADPSIGWQANVESWNREGITPPIVAPGMSR